MILDEIELLNGKKYVGIVDFVNIKHLYMFDFTNTDVPEYVILSILWKSSNPDTRFSIWCMKNYPSIKLPPVLLFPIRTVKNNTHTPTVINKGRKCRHIFKVESISG